MSVSPELMYAILSMDAYNRGYDPGIDYGGGNSIANATVMQESDTSLGGDDVAAGFYAVEYMWNSDTIISYRGTNTGSEAELLADIWNGWTVGGGFSAASQAGLAINFYEAVTGQSLYDGVVANTLLTGHSLGGGLAGFVSALSKTGGVGFDHMPFGLAAWAQYASDYIAGNVTGNAPDLSLFEGISVDTIKGDILLLMNIVYELLACFRCYPRSSSMQPSAGDVIFERFLSIHLDVVEVSFGDKLGILNESIHER